MGIDVLLSTTRLVAPMRCFTIPANMTVPTCKKFIGAILRFLAQDSEPVPAEVANEAAAESLNLSQRWTMPTSMKAQSDWSLNAAQHSVSPFGFEFHACSKSVPRFRVGSIES
jgi:hypothetical protein